MRNEFDWFSDKYANSIWLLVGFSTFYPLQPRLHSRNLRSGSTFVSLAKRLMKSKLTGPLKFSRIAIWRILWRGLRRFATFMDERGWWQGRSSFPLLKITSVATNINQTMEPLLIFTMTLNRSLSSINISWNGNILQVTLNLQLSYF